MLSRDAKRYAIGNLLAGPGQWKRMYSTGSGLAFAVNMSLAYLNILPGLSTGTSAEGTARMIETLMLELINAMMPLTAVALDRPFKAVFTVILYIVGGLIYWTLSYEASTGGI